MKKLSSVVLGISLLASSALFAQGNNENKTVLTTTDQTPLSLVCELGEALTNYC